MKDYITKNIEDCKKHIYESKRLQFFVVYSIAIVFYIILTKDHSKKLKAIRTKVLSEFSNEDNITKNITQLRYYILDAFDIVEKNQERVLTDKLKSLEKKLNEADTNDITIAQEINTLHRRKFRDYREFVMQLTNNIEYDDMRHIVEQNTNDLFTILTADLHHKATLVPDEHMDKEYIATDYQYRRVITALYMNLFRETGK